jgi:hypothetical protein
MNLENLENKEQVTDIIKKSRQSTFRLNAKNLFLTYPRCPLTREQVREQIQQKFEARGLIDYLIVQENHFDGNIRNTQELNSNNLETTSNLFGQHIHVMVRLNKKVNYRKPEALDLMGPPEKEKIHGFYESVRNMENLVTYLKKEDRHFISTLKKDIFTQLYLQSVIKGPRLAVRDYIVTNPESAARNTTALYTNLMKALDILEDNVEKPKYSITQFENIPDVLVSYILNDEPQYKEKSLVIIGEPSIGKTELVISLATFCKKGVLRVRQMDDLKKFEKGLHGLILLDDCNLSLLSLDNRRNVLERRRDTTLYSRYNNTKLDSKPPRIVISNSLRRVFGHKGFDYDENPDTQYEYQSLIDRTIIIYLKDKLYSEQQPTININIQNINIENNTGNISLNINNQLELNNIVNTNNEESNWGLLKERMVPASYNRYD